MNSILEKEMSSLKKQHLDNVFDTWNYLSEIKVGFFLDFELGPHANSVFESLLSQADNDYFYVNFWQNCAILEKWSKKRSMMLQSSWKIDCCTKYCFRRLQILTIWVNSIRLMEAQNISMYHWHVYLLCMESIWFLEQCLARSSIGTIWWLLQLNFKQTWADISWRY